MYQISFKRGTFVLITLWIPAKLLQSCPTLCDHIDGSPPRSPVPGILQARILEWVAISFSNAWKWIVKVKSLSHVWLLATPWTAAYQAPPSMGFSRQEYWSGVPLPSPITVWSVSKTTICSHLGVGIVVKVFVVVLSHVQLFETLQTCSSPGKNTGVGCRFLLQGIFLIKRSNLCLLHLLHWEADSLPLHYLGNKGEN